MFYKLVKLWGRRGWKSNIFLHFGKDNLEDDEDENDDENHKDHNHDEDGEVDGDDEDGGSCMLANKLGNYPRNRPLITPIIPQASGTYYPV